MRILVIVAAALVLASPALAQEAELPPAVEAALIEFEAWPEDFGAARQLGEVAASWGIWDLALKGWERAEQLGGPSHDVALGKVVPLLELGRTADARRAAKEATVLTPESGAAWRLLAWSRRQTNRWQAGTYARLGAASAYRTALRVDPEDRSAACGIAWTALERGDRLGATRGFQALLAHQAEDACALSGMDAAAPRWRVGGGFWLSGYAYSNSTSTAGVSGLLAGWIGFADLVTLELTGRLLAIESQVDTAKIVGTQGEFWARLGVSHSGHGGELLVGLLDRSSRSVTETVVGGRAWATFGATARIEGAVSTFEDGTAALIGAGLRVPVFSLLGVDAAVQFTRWMPTSDTSTPVGALVSGSVILDPFDALSIELTGRGGVGWAPIRFDQPAIWNTAERQLGGAAVTVTGRLTPFLSLRGGYEAVALGAAANTTTASTSWTHVFSLGVTVEHSGGLKK